MFFSAALCATNSDFFEAGQEKAKAIWTRVTQMNADHSVMGAAGLYCRPHPAGQRFALHPLCPDPAGKRARIRMINFEASGPGTLSCGIRTQKVAEGSPRGGDGNRVPPNPRSSALICVPLSLYFSLRSQRPRGVLFLLFLGSYVMQGKFLFLLSCRCLARRDGLSCRRNRPCRDLGSRISSCRRMRPGSQ